MPFINQKVHNYTKFAFKGQKMKNLTKNSVANVAKVGVASALIGAGLFLSACGGGDNQKRKIYKRKSS